MPARAQIEQTHQGSLLPPKRYRTKDRLKRFERFCEDYLTIPHGFGVGTPMWLTSTQRRWVRSFIANPVTLVKVARGNAKSTTTAAWCLFTLIDPPDGDENPEVYVVSGSKDQARAALYDSIVQMIGRSPTLDLWCHTYRDSNSPRIECTNGGVIAVRAANTKDLQGLHASLMVLDEASVIDETVWTTLTGGLGKRPSDRVVAIGTPMYEQAGILYTHQKKHEAGELNSQIRFIDHAPDAELERDDLKAWRQANPVRREINPEGWLGQLELMRSTMSDGEFDLFALARFADFRGASPIDPDDWDALEGHSIDPDVHDQLGVYVAVVGDWHRRSCAVVAASPDDTIVNVTLLGCWENHPTPIPTGDIRDAVTALGDPVSVTLGRGQQAGELARGLELSGIAVDDVNTTTQGPAMAAPTDELLRLISDGTLRHDGNPVLRSHALRARQDVQRQGIVFAKDDRTSERIDALLAMAQAVALAVEAPVPQIY